MTKIPLFEFPTYTEIDLAPNKVERVDFLLIAPGDAGESRFGHVTLLFKMCKKSLQPEELCPKKEKEQDVVITYAADLRDATWVNPLKGLFGQYYSATSIVYLDTAQESYVYLENRRLEPYPLKLTLQQKDNLVLQVLTDFWSFEGNYRFITKNCSTEARDVIKSILGIHQFDTKQPILPNNLKTALIEAKLIDPKPIQIYDSAINMVEKRLALAMGADKKKKYASKLIKLAPQNRISWYKSHMKAKLTPLDKLAWENVEKIVSRARQVKEIHRLSGENAKELRELTQQIAIFREGYGIPSAYRVKMPDDARLPYRAEMDVFSAGEKAVYTWISL